MPVSTSRYNLVAADNAHQKKDLRFLERFGYLDAMVVVVTGGHEKARRQKVDRLCARFEQLPALAGRTLGRIGVQQMAELLLLMEPDFIAIVRAGLTDGTSLADLIERGLPGWIQAIVVQLNTALEEPSAVTPTDREAELGLRRLSVMLRALDAQLGGKDALNQLPLLSRYARLPRGIGVDEAGYLVGGGGSYHIIALFPQLPQDDPGQMVDLVDRIRGIRAELATGSVTVELTGLPAIESDEVRSIRRGLLQTSIATTIGILLLLYLAFRSVRYTLLVVVPLGVGVVTTLALARFFYGGLNLVTSCFAPVLLALGIDFGVYVLSRYGENVRNGAGADDSVRAALRGAGPGILVGAVTSVLAFLTTATTEFTAYGELGIITAVGLALMLATTFLILPAVLRLASRGRPIAAPELPLVSALGTWVRAHRYAILVVAGLLLVGSATIWKRVSFNPRYMDFLPKSTESARGFARIERDETVSPIHAVMMVDTVAAARQLTEQLRDLPSVAAVQSASDVLPALTPQRLAKLRASFVGLKRQPDFQKLRSHRSKSSELSRPLADLEDALDELAFALRQAGHNTEAIGQAQRSCISLRRQVDKLPDDAPALLEIERLTTEVLQRAWNSAQNVAHRGQYLPSDLPPAFQARFVSRDGGALAVYANPAGDIWDTATAKRFNEQVESVAPDASGAAINIYQHLRMIREGFSRAAVISAAMVLIVLLVAFRRLSDALLALVPVLIGFGWMLGLMAALSLSFDAANIVVLPLILGIGIDAGAHLIHRYRTSAAEHGRIAMLDEVVRTTGAAVLLASLTTAVGFGALMLGDYGGMKSLGLVMTIGIGCCLIASMVVLPSILLVLRKAR